VSGPVLSQGLLLETDLGLYREFRVLHCVVCFLLLLRCVLQAGVVIPGGKGSVEV
jgi:hypothetical protein